MEKLCKYIPFFYKIVYLPSTPEERSAHWESLVAKLGEMDAELRQGEYFTENNPNNSHFLPLQNIHS